MKRLAVAGACALGLGAAVAGVGRAEIPMHGPPVAAASLLAAERAFAARSLEAGAEKAFAEYVDPVDGRAFDGGDPLRGAAAIARSHADGGTPAWTPSEVFVAQAGDMGTVWGTWTYAFPKTIKVAMTGRYVTVWRKDPAGAWKAIIDIGAPDDKPKP